MKRSHQIVILSVAIGLVAFVGVKVFQKPIAQVVIDKMAARSLGFDVAASLPDGLHVGLCGSAGPLATRDRRAGCAFVIAGGALYVIDAGSGAAGTLGLMGLDVGGIDAVLLTHFHSDHIDGLGQLMMNRHVQGQNLEPLPVYGPPGVARVVAGFGEAYALDGAYRTAHHGEAIVPTTGRGGTAVTFHLAHRDGTQIILESGGLTVTAFAVDHEPAEPSVGYRFDYGGRSVVISGDTAPSPAVVAQAKGVDVLVHEALQKTLIGSAQKMAEENGFEARAKILADIPGYHTSPEEAAQIAAKAGARYLLLTHLVPALPKFFDPAFLGGAADYYDGPITVGQDGFLLSLPSGSREIETRELL